MTEGNLVKDRINQLLDDGYTNSQEIVTQVVNELNIKRPTVRRLARELRIDLIKKLSILEGYSRVIQ